MRRSALEAELASVLGGAPQARWLVDALAADVGSNAELAPSVVDEARRRAGAVAAGWPLQYAIGTWGFRTLELEVTNAVLIPRPETEQVVGAALSAWRAEPRPRCCILDLCTGSGAMGLSAWAELSAEGGEVSLTLSDLSAAALEVARANARRCGAPPDTQFALGDLYEPLPADLLGRVDLLLANPPYVAHEEVATLDLEVLAEPRMALVAEDGQTGVPGAALCEAVLSGAAPWLAPGAVLALECAPPQVDRLVELAEALGTVTEVVDLAGRRRGLVVRCR